MTKRYEAQEKQSQFHYADADEVLYGGAAGGGKSEAIIWDAVTFCMEFNQVKVAIFRRTFPELEKSIILRFMEKVPRKWFNYNRQQQRITFKENGSMIEFNHCQYDTDVFKYQSAEYDRIYFDELTHFNEYVYQYLRSRLRTTKKEVHPQIKSASNPGNIGHLWVKKRFIDDAKVGEVIKRHDPASNVDFTTQFIPAKVYDNKYIMENDPAYIKRLMQLPEDERKALLDGDWNVFQGQFFTEWRNDLHTSEPFEIPTGWRRFRTMDWGYSQPTCVLWMAIDNDKRIWVYKELYVTQTNDIDLAIMIKDYTGDERIEYTIADPSLWSVTQFEKGESIAMRLMHNGIPLIKGDNNRLSGASTFHSYLALNSRDHKPNVIFFNTCYNCLRTIPALIHDHKRPEDVDTDSEDHAYDSARYGLMAHPLSPVKAVVYQSMNTFQAYLNKIKEKRHKQYYAGRL